jgi:hypothetical protein
MPKKNIDYSKSIIYKIYSKDENIKECYVGITTDITRRIYQHKQSSKNEKNKNIYLYSFINENGGFINWTFEKIEDYPCNNSIEGHDRETYWINKLEADLNSILPFDKSLWKKEWYYKNQERIRLHQKEYREKVKQCKINKQQEPVDNNPECIINNVKRQSLLLI